jgi:hypothetical protein
MDRIDGGFKLEAFWRGQVVHEGTSLVLVDTSETARRLDSALKVPKPLES